jgi:hypothetical protein
MRLPLGKQTTQRLRHVLGHHRYADAEQWWFQHIHDLLSMTGREFAAVHDVSEASVSIWRRRITGEQRARPEGWWMTPRTIELARSGLSTYALAHILKISTSLAWNLKRRAMGSAADIPSATSA